MSRQGSHGITLIELTITIALLLILMSLAFPIIHAASVQVDRTTCISNLQHLGQAIISYKQDTGAYPTMPGFIGANGIPTGGATGLAITDPTVTLHTLWCKDDPKYLNRNNSSNSLTDPNSETIDTTDSTYNFGYNYYGYVTTTEGLPFPVTTPDAACYFFGNPTVVDSSSTTQLNTDFSTYYQNTYGTSSPASTAVTAYGASWDLGFFNTTTINGSKSYAKHPKGLFQGLWNSSAPEDTIVSFCPNHPVGGGDAVMALMLSGSAQLIKVVAPSANGVAGFDPTYEDFPRWDPQHVINPNVIGAEQYMTPPPPTTSSPLPPAPKPNALITTQAIKPCDLPFPHRRPDDKSIEWGTITVPATQYSSQTPYDVWSYPGANLQQQQQNYAVWTPPIDWRIHKAPLVQGKTKAADFYGDAINEGNVTNMPLVTTYYRKFNVQVPNPPNPNITPDLQPDSLNKYYWYDTSIPLQQHDIVMVVANAKWNYLAANKASWDSTITAASLAGGSSLDSQYQTLFNSNQMMIFTADGDPISITKPFTSLPQKIVPSPTLQQNPDGSLVPLGALVGEIYNANPPPGAAASCYKPFGLRSRGSYILQPLEQGNLYLTINNGTYGGPDNNTVTPNLTQNGTNLYNIESGWCEVWIAVYHCP